jgi:hypothetical protein
MRKQNDVNQKGKLDALAAPATKKKYAPTPGLEDVFFIWRTVSNGMEYAKADDKLKYKQACCGSLQGSSHGGCKGDG